MSRVIFEREPGGDSLELRVGALPAAAGVLSAPSPRDMARAVSAMRREWFMQFIEHLHKESVGRAFEVAAAAQRAMDQDALEFGVNPGDSAALLELRTAIDMHLGWSSQDDEERADYPGRVREIGEALDALQGLRSVRLRASR